MEFIKRLIGHELISGSFYLFLGGMVGNFFAFLLNLFLARNLSYVDYGIFASLLSILTLAIIPAGSISTIIVKFATNYYAKNQIEQFSGFYRLSAKALTLISLAFLALFLLLSIPITSFLRLDNFWYGTVIAFTISIFYLNTLNQAFLQSLLKFRTISFIGILASVVKLAAGILFVYMGFRAFSGIFALFLMALGSFFIAFIPLKAFIKAKTKGKINFPKKEILAYSIPAFLIVLFFTSLTSMDVILVKHFFNSSEAGFYAGLSLIGKVIFYFTFPIPAVLFPLLVKRHATGASFKKLFYLAIVLVFIPAFGISLFYVMFPNFVITLFLGGRDYLEISKFLGMFGLYMTIISLINVCVNFFLSFNETKIWLFIIPAAILQIVLISLFHASFYQVIYVSIFIAFALFITLLSYYFKKFNI